MYANGFLEEKRRSPVSFGAVVGLHVAALSAVIMFGTTTFQREAPQVIDLIPIRPDRPIPPENPPPPTPDQPIPQSRDTPTTAPTPLPVPGPFAGPPTPPRPYETPVDPGPIRLAGADVRPVIPDPVRIGAQVDPRYRDALQPPYPRDMETAQREGSVRVRITIGPDGRVTAIEQLSATNDSFWRITQRQAMNRWRFRPATVDGRAIASTMVFTVTFRLPEA
jgi:protein TonB